MNALCPLGLQLGSLLPDELLELLNLGLEIPSLCVPIESLRTEGLESLAEVVNVCDPVGFRDARLGAQLVERGFGLLELTTEGTDRAVLGTLVVRIADMGKEEKKERGRTRL